MLPDAEKLVALTETRAPVLVPELRLHLMPAGQTFEAFRAEVEPLAGLAPPYWAVPWPGGQALARYLLDNPCLVGGRRVIDAGAGSALGAIAAARAGAVCAVALEPDPAARAIAQINARINEVDICPRDGDIAAIDPETVDVVLAGDLWYEPMLARRATAAARGLAARGVVVLAGDPGRAAFPRNAIERLASYRLAASEELERGATVSAHVWRFLA